MSDTTFDGEVEAPTEEPSPAGPAICHRCGGPKRGPYVPCKACGFVPTGRERQVAWLFSEHHLSPEELDEAARRLRGGERPDPPRALLETARVGMGAAAAGDEGGALRNHELLALTLGNLLLTPLVGFATWWGLSEERPVASAQALRVTVPVAGALALAWGVLLASWVMV